MKCSMTTLVVLGYLVGGLTTFGWNYNHHPEWSTADRQFGSGVSGIVWPLYWLGVVAIKATAP